MFRVNVIAIVFLIPCIANGGFADDSPVEGVSKEIARIEALGGRVQRDENRPGHPVIAVSLAGCEKLKDDDLQLMSAFPELRTLQLSATETTDAGLKYMAGLKNLTHLGLIGTKITDAGLVRPELGQAGWLLVAYYRS